MFPKCFAQALGTQPRISRLVLWHRLTAMSSGQWKSTGFSEWNKVPTVPRSGSQPSGNVVLSSAADGLDMPGEDLPDWSLTSPMYVHFWIRNPCPSQIRDRNLCWAKTCVQCRPTRESMHACMHACTYVRTYIHTYVRTYVRRHARADQRYDRIHFVPACVLLVFVLVQYFAFVV